METEIWKDVIGYEGRYQVSNLGNVMSLNYMHTGRSHLLAQATNVGYKRVILCNEINPIKNIPVHRLVAINFIENPLNKPQVNHINGIKTDNMVSNLEWCTALENQMHAYRTGLKTGSCGEKNGMYGKRGNLSPAFGNKYSVGRSGKLHVNSKPVIQYGIDGNVIKIFESGSIAGDKTGIDRSSISRSCKGKQVLAGGFKWKYQ